MSRANRKGSSSAPGPHGAFRTGGVVAAGSFDLRLSERFLNHYRFPDPVATVDPDPEPDPIVEIAIDAPVLAHRYAGMRITPKRRVQLESVNRGIDLPIDADAECRRSSSFLTTTMLNQITTSPAVYVDPTEPPPHKNVPDVHCQCGFYAVPLGRPIPESYLKPAELVVELSGRLIELDNPGDVGHVMYRAGHQKVLEVRLVTCPFCGRPPTGVHVAPSTMKVTRTTCGGHGRFHSDAFVSVADLDRMCPVPVVAVTSDG